MGEKYHYVRHRWWGQADVDGLVEVFGDYELELKKPPEDLNKLSIQGYNLKELWVKSDTLMAFLSPHRAVLSQRMRTPFTGRDMELRRRVFKLYPRSRPTPLPFNVNTEPDFKVVEKTQGVLE